MLVFDLAASYLARGGRKDCHSWQRAGANRLKLHEDLPAEDWWLGCDIVQCALPFGGMSGR
jgi:hypothetical protein